MPICSFGSDEMSPLPTKRQRLVNCWKFPAITWTHQYYKVFLSMKNVFNFFECFQFMCRYVYIYIYIAISTCISHYGTNSKRKITQVLLCKLFSRFLNITKSKVTRTSVWQEAESNQVKHGLPSIFKTPDFVFFSWSNTELIKMQAQWKDEAKSLLTQTATPVRQPPYHEFKWKTVNYIFQNFTPGLY